MIKTQFIHTLTNSFMLWADHTLLKNGEAFENTTGQLYNYTDSRLPTSYNVFGSSYKQWVADSSITGATIPSGVYADGVFKGRADGLTLDFDNGRVISSGISTGSTVTGSFAVKDFNFYFTNEDEESLVIETSKDYSRIGTDLNITYLPPYDSKVPAIFVTNQTQENSPFAFGGLDTTEIKMNMTVFAKNPYQLDGVLGVFADTNDQIFYDVPFEANPYNEYGDLKNGTYNYETLIAASGTIQFSVDEVRTSKMTDSLKRSLQTELYIGFVDMKISTVRNR
jgi:hypothetical protein